MFDVLVGINLLREGLDLPEVSLVAILDADKEGFLRSHRSLIQTVGRASRNVNGRVIMYGDKVTRSMRWCIDETLRRRAIQEKHNKAHGITPTTITKRIADLDSQMALSDLVEPEVGFGKRRELAEKGVTVTEQIATLRKEMLEAADGLQFERAAELRDEIRRLESSEIGLRDKTTA